MKISSFFRLLNFKIKQYEKAASNPFGDKYRGKYMGKYMYPQTIIWVEDIPTSEHFSGQP